ncbi:tRNA (adenosine(37)-N6)-threonylcarbamoyltransferase complex ATPase subunit type 1 TsaE [Actinomyces vulturis]|uniref:tRNA (adenosine(37)-N6)-threonylcarbamoyltransferase complex ATPase subunit type 1 TsaE n=1 Tax=Actinomyces vulturis TaxID=1857645 RepID=UPI00082AD019|nr:tRNA (adenosine(37)-N6)-threonylcarbamoyltransferase complex ATPase subunit type 1 TsaE [Actinomyces vulturis]
MTDTTAPQTSSTVQAQCVVRTHDADETRMIGAALARFLRAGDMVMLSGGLGAGKTTLSQGIGSALNVEGRVCSPTFIIARVHPALADGPDLIHVDAYRISSLDEVEALDLDSSLEESVTLIEWGEGKVEGLSDDRLMITVGREEGGVDESETAAIYQDENGASLVDISDLDDGSRTITITALGQRWQGVDFTPLSQVIPN